MRFLYSRNDSVCSESVSSISSVFPLPVQKKGSSAAVFEIVGLLKRWRAENENQMYTLVEVSCAVQEVLLRRQERKTRKWLLYWIALVAFFAVFSASIGFSILAIRLARDHRLNNLNLVNTKDENNPSTVQYYSYVPVNEIGSLDLEKIEKMGSLILQWGTPGSKDAKNFFFAVLSAFKNTTDESTVLNLSSEYKFIANQHEAILYDNENNEVGTIKFQMPRNPAKSENVGEKKNTYEEGKTLGDINVDSDNTIYKDAATTNSFRRLHWKETIMKKLMKGVSPIENIEDPLQNYCKYGCGAMSVTFPYYYRPFFGYGFPLVGTESMFPQGYGGYAAAPLLARQATQNRYGNTLPLNGNNMANGNTLPLTLG